MYCIKCGVELADSEKRCPLCNTPVINPKTYGLEEDTAVYKNYEKVGGLHIDFRFIAVIISILLLIPIFITSIFFLLTPHLTNSSTNQSQQANLNVGLSIANFDIVFLLK